MGAGGSFRDTRVHVCTGRGLSMGWVGLHPCWVPRALGWLDPLPQGRACSPTLGTEAPLPPCSPPQLGLCAGWDPAHRRQQAGDFIV